MGGFFYFHFYTCHWVVIYVLERVFHMIIGKQWVANSKGKRKCGSDHHGITFLSWIGSEQGTHIYCVLFSHVLLLIHRGKETLFGLGRFLVLLYMGSLQLSHLFHCFLLFFLSLSLFIVAIHPTHSLYFFLFSIDLSLYSTHTSPSLSFSVKHLSCRSL